MEQTKVKETKGEETVISLLELRVVKEKAQSCYLRKKISSPEMAWEVATNVLHMHEQAEEVFAMITLNTNNMVTGAFIVSRGQLNASLVHPREVFKRALLQNAASIMLMHNHPSGNLQPSTEDIKITRRLVEAGELLGINVLDHIIVGTDIGDERTDGYISMKEVGNM